MVTNEIGEVTGDEPQPSTSAETVAPIEPEIAVSTAGDLLMQATEGNLNQYITNNINVNMSMSRFGCSRDNSHIRGREHSNAFAN